ncbi:hypothetical protein AB751O23_AV_00020 [Chlamydiales bacterium SCGC AB-751-O23]|nr:hypothetical protein AB751O23_AV_00020 [Chlamydiales bacterium SCGC AB-751-O23]
MNVDWIKDIGRQLLQVWREIKTFQKFTVIVVALSLFGLLSFLIVNAAAVKYSALYPVNRLTISDASEVKNYLDASRISYDLKSDTLILVPQDQVHKIRMDLASMGLPKKHRGKGFELFDSNTWIKGEKELQVLEMRALKGQLEQDITAYDNLKGARVILDMAPPRPFGGSTYKTKASAILDLMPGARLGQSQLRAITYHISGAVRGLTPNMVALSDTTGKLYQAHDPDGDVDLLRSAEIAAEERLKSKVDGMLAMVVGMDNFYSTVQVSMDREQSSNERRIYSGTVGAQALGDPVVMSLTESGLEMMEREKQESGAPGASSEAVAGAVAGGEQSLNRNESRVQEHKQMAVPYDHLKTQSKPGKINGISIGVLIDKTITVSKGSDLPEEEIKEGMRNAVDLKDEIESQLAKIVQGYAVAAVPSVDFVEFDKTRFHELEAEVNWTSNLQLLSKAGTALFIVLTALGMFWTFTQFWRKTMVQPPKLDKEEDDEFQLETEFSEGTSLVEVEAMVEAVKQKLHDNPYVVVETIREWLAEGKEFKVNKKR